MKDKTESVTIEVAPDGSTQPDTLSCPAAPLPDAEASVEAKPFIAEADSTKTKALTNQGDKTVEANHTPTKPKRLRVSSTFRLVVHGSMLKSMVRSLRKTSSGFSNQARGWSADP